MSECLVSSGTQTPAFCTTTMILLTLRFAQGQALINAHGQNGIYFIPLISFVQTFLSKRKVWLQ
jgi:hypothetical protein